MQMRPDFGGFGRWASEGYLCFRKSELHRHLRSVGISRRIHIISRYIANVWQKNVSCLLRCLQILEIMILLWKRWLQIGKMHLWFACFYSIGLCVLMLPGVTGMPWMDSHDSSPSSDAPSSGASGDMAISLVENLGVQPWTVWPLNGWCLQWNMNLALNS